MCETCGCTITAGNEHLAGARDAERRTTVEVLQDLLAANDHVAQHNRAHFDEHGVLAINLMSSPGAGKTALAGGDDRGAARPLPYRGHRG